MKFWDASGLVPLFIAESATRKAAQLYRSDPRITVWALTRVDLLFALARRRREGTVDRSTLERAREELFNASRRWVEVSQLTAVREHAELLIAKHPLRAADALQLGAAMVAADGDPASLDFVTFDLRLAEAARREGFPVKGVDD